MASLKMTEDEWGHQLTFDPKRKEYITKNQKYIIRPPLSKELKEEELHDSELAKTRFVLKTNNATMYGRFFLHSPLSFECVKSKCVSCLMRSSGDVTTLCAVSDGKSANGFRYPGFTWKRFAFLNVHLTQSL